ncbi:MAG: hypothetical protein JWR38_2768 [Mucilaginibacter sp.]|nr:hypothetical protein [Mucilaginibacter sp.]
MSLRGGATKTTDRRELINTNKNKHSVNNLYIGRSIMLVYYLVPRSVQHRDCFVPRNDALVVLLHEPLIHFYFVNLFNRSGAAPESFIL